MGYEAVRVRIDSVLLTGTDRAVEFRPGLNIVTGPITTGKTTLLRLCRLLLGSRGAAFPQEIRATSSAVAGRIILDDKAYTIIRPLVTTATAPVEIAGSGEALRLPAFNANRSFNTWLLEHLGLPQLQVPSAPSRPESEPTPITINDYFLYCDLTQSEIDDSVFGHKDPYKNIKRKYVFEILYGTYGIQTALLHEELRNVELEIRALRSDRAVLERLLVDTPWSNRALLEVELQQSQLELRNIESTITSLRERSESSPTTQGLRLAIQSLDADRSQLLSTKALEQGSVERLRELMHQLEAQVERLIRAIVSEERLIDFEFVVCPRCGTTVDSSRARDDVCMLCLQHPTPNLTREDLVKEQDRLSLQVSETGELISARNQRIDAIEAQIKDLNDRRIALSQELEFQEKTFISDFASSIADSAAERARITERVTRLRDYLGLFQKFDQAALRLDELLSRRARLESDLELQRAADENVRLRLQYLNQKFSEILETFNVPRFESANLPSRIDPITYLPTLYGRRFDELSSQGLKVLVNVAHAIAHQLTSIELRTRLPNILLIDGLTSNIGHREGLDEERVEAVYDYLMSLSALYGDSLQIIVADNDVPSKARDFVVMEFSENDRLAPVRNRG